LLTLLSIYLAFSGYYGWTFAVALLTAITLTTEYVTKIDLAQKQYSDYLFFLGFELNKEYKKFNTLDRIIITKGDYAQTINTRIQSRQLNWTGLHRNLTH
jgi:hypothetical protein